MVALRSCGLRCPVPSAFPVRRFSCLILSQDRRELTVEGQIRTQKGDPRLEPRIPVVLAERLGRERSGVARLDRYRHVGLRHLIATPVTGLSKGQPVEVVP